MMSHVTGPGGMARYTVVYVLRGGDGWMGMETKKAWEGSGNRLENGDVRLNERLAFVSDQQTSSPRADQPRRAERKESHVGPF